MGLESSAEHGRAVMRKAMSAQRKHCGTKKSFLTSHCLRRCDSRPCGVDLCTSSCYEVAETWLATEITRKKLM